MSQTFEIVGEGKAIKCLTCGLTSHHPKDVEYLWCAKCNRFHDVPDPVPLSRDQYRLLHGIMTGGDPPAGLTDSPHRLILSFFQRGLLVTVDGMVRPTERALTALRAYEDEA